MKYQEDAKDMNKLIKKEKILKIRNIEKGEGAKNKSKIRNLNAEEFFFNKSGQILLDIESLFL